MILVSEMDTTSTIRLKIDLMKFKIAVQIFTFKFEFYVFELNVQEMVKIY